MDMSDNPLIIKPKSAKIKGEDGHRTFSIRVKDDTVKRLDEIAQKTSRSRNEIIGIFLEYAAEHCVVEE